MSLSEVHAGLANTATYYVAILALWGLWRYFRKQPVDSSYWGALAIAEILIVVQGALGGYLWLTGLRPGRSIHILYGVFSAIVIPAIYLYTKGDERRQVLLIYGVSLLILVGLIIRATLTGQTGLVSL